jgi:hypothetical protein
VKTFQKTDHRHHVQFVQLTGKLQREFQVHRFGIDPFLIVFPIKIQEELFAGSFVDL